MSDLQISCITGRHKPRKRIGRGTGSGRGKTCGRGHKGAGSRAGAMLVSLYQGGQLPQFRRLPKRGFSNFNFARRYEVVNVSQLERFDDGSTVGPEQFCDAGLVAGKKSRVKILGDGEFSKKLQVVAHRFSKSAEQKILGCGGTAQVI